MFEKFKQKVKESFSKSAMTYDCQPELHDEVIDKLLAKITGSHSRILDIGCGTGKLVGKLAKKFPAARIIGLDLAPGMVKFAQDKIKLPNARFIEGDGEALPFQPEQFDLIVSTASMQWMSAGKAIVEAARVLSPQGKYYFATFGPRTLAELKKAGLAINYFLDQERLENLLKKVFQKTTIETVPIVKSFNNSIEAVKYLKAIGANVYDSPLETKPARAKLATGKIDVTFEVIYGVCEK
ncbi:MAG: methyltransferase domain-containing protein [bacterium]